MVEPFRGVLIAEQSKVLEANEELELLIWSVERANAKILNSDLTNPFATSSMLGCLDRAQFAIASFDIQGDQLLQGIKLTYERRLPLLPIVSINVPVEGILAGFSISNPNLIRYKNINEVPLLVGHFIYGLGYQLGMEDNMNQEAGIYTNGDLVVDMLGMSSMVLREEIKLKPKEFDLLSYFIRNKGRSISHEELSVNVWGGGISRGSLRVAITSLKHKLGEDAETAKYIHLVWSYGYIMPDFSKDLPTGNVE